MDLFKIDGPDYWGRVPVSRQEMLGAATDAGHEESCFVLGDEHRDETPVALVLRMKPNGVVVRHVAPPWRIPPHEFLYIKGNVTRLNEKARTGQAVTDILGYMPEPPPPNRSKTVKVSPTAERVVDVLSFLSRYPDQRFTMSALARELQINKATIHTLLVTLTKHSFLLRHPVDKSYRLGPALVGLGESAALDAHEAADFAHPELRAISEELKMLCVIGAAVGSEIIILAHLNPNSRLGAFPRMGQRLPFVPPIGAIFAAWASPEEVAAWIDRGGQPAEANAERYREHLRQIRERGFAVNLAPFAGSEIARTLANEQEVATSRTSSNPALDHLLTASNTGRRSATARTLSLVAPVFHADGRVLLSLNMEAGADAENTDLLIYADRLLAAAERVTNSIHGLAPHGWPPKN